MAKLQSQSQSQNQGSKPNTLKQDDSIMATNNSSIVSKRSVERLYYPNEPHFFRYFVKKPQRRSPLINRGYWLRMKVIEFVIRRFLEQPSTKPKIVMNLGCGYDVNVWQCLLRYPKVCADVKFIDVDYMPLMLKKRDMVMKTNELVEALTNLCLPESGPALLCSDQYLQVGCDLSDLSKLAESLASVVDLKEYMVLCTAEVSITYMKIEAANALIDWACNLPKVQFCLLEQILPNGSDHPFAKKMLAHFEKLQTPIKAARVYPTTSAQESRFAHGWTDVWSQSLWDLWNSEDFLTSTERLALDDIEPFDEWEEFALFGCHYFLLVASNSPEFNTPPRRPNDRFSEVLPPKTNPTSITSTTAPPLRGCRRFAAPISVRAPNRRQRLVGNFAGMGPNVRLNSCDVYSPISNSNDSFPRSELSELPCARMCHTVTDLGEAGALLVGGRSSPNNALADCWLYHEWTNTWERVDSLPAPRYRHSATLIKSGIVLVAGGKSDSRTIVTEFCLWSRLSGWICCALSGKDNPAVFGAIFTTTTEASAGKDSIRGIVAGGISQDNTISEDVWMWTLRNYDKMCPSISFEKRAACIPSLARFGATAVRHDGQLFLIGGVARDYILPFEEDVMIIDIEDESGLVALRGLQLKPTNPRPFLVGSSAFSSGKSLIIMGGGAVCFSFGTYWNTDVLSLCHNHDDSGNSHKQLARAESPLVNEAALECWKYSHTIELCLREDLRYSQADSFHPKPTHRPEMTQVSSTKIASSLEFREIIDGAKPVVLKDLNLGSCTQTWTNEYLVEQIGRDRNIVVHQASTAHMDFLGKNFRYVSQPFGAFMQSIQAGEKLYLRSLSAEKPSEKPANLKLDFPSIAPDFQLPASLEFVQNNAHSSPLRISGPVDMWLHYDVMANILCQIRGTKRLLLFPPSDIRHFHFPPGASSSSVDVFASMDDPQYAGAHPHEVVLCPGDVLFLPPFWLHCASPTDGVSVAVNVFFRNLVGGYGTGKDVYGNRDLHAYEKGRQDVAKIGNSFNTLPVEVRDFYIYRLAEELGGKVGQSRN